MVVKNNPIAYLENRGTDGLLTPIYTTNHITRTVVKSRGASVTITHMASMSIHTAVATTEPMIWLNGTVQVFPQAPKQQGLQALEGTHTDGRWYSASKMQRADCYRR